MKMGLELKDKNIRKSHDTFNNIYFTYKLDQYFDEEKKSLIFLDISLYISLLSLISLSTFQKKSIIYYFNDNITDYVINHINSGLSNNAKYFLVYDY